ncbi:MAG: tyrosine-type recombinase/integrase [Bryobacteraceae bacterium]
MKGRWHDNRHTLVTELAESGAGDEVIMSIAGHVSRAMLWRYSHVRMEAKRRALDEIAARQRAADESRLQEADRHQPAAVVPQSAVVQCRFKLPGPSPVPFAARDRAARRLGPRSSRFR